MGPRDTVDLRCRKYSSLSGECSTRGFRRAFPPESWLEAGLWLREASSSRACCPRTLRALASAGVLCHLELKNFAEAMNWCDEGLRIDAREKKLLEMRAKADKLKVGGRISSQLAFVTLH